MLSSRAQMDSNQEPKIRRVLFHEDDRRRLPSMIEVQGLLEQECCLSDLLRGPMQFFFIPTKEWVCGFAKLCRCLRIHRILEIGAGDGFVASCLLEQGLDVKAVDPFPTEFLYHPVQPMSHQEALHRFQPELAFWCWPPMKSLAPEDILKFPSVRFYIDIGDGGRTTGQGRLFAAYENRYLQGLSQKAYGWIDVRGYLHHRSFLFYGRAHEKHQEFKTSSHPLAPNVFTRDI